MHIPPSTFFLIWALFVTYNQRNQQQGYLKIYILHLGVTPLWGCHPVRSAPPHPPSDATESHCVFILHLLIIADINTRSIVTYRDYSFLFARCHICIRRL